LEFCGGTHVDGLGQIGPITLVSEGSIGSNTRRIEAVTGHAALGRARDKEHLVASAAELLRTDPDDLIPALERLMARQRETEKELSALKQRSSAAEAGDLAAGAIDGVVVARRDGIEPDALRTLAEAVRRHQGVRAVVLGGSPDGEKVALSAVTGGTPDAKELVRALGPLVGGGGGGSAEVAQAGGKNPGGLDDALAEAQRLLSA
jgi:alanyl-tRNA synthetase